MKRRYFLKTAVAGTAAAGTLSAIASCSQETKSKEAQYLEALPSLDQLMVIENEFLRVEVMNNAATTIIDKISNNKWNSGPVSLQEMGVIEEGHVWLRQDRNLCDQYPGRFIGKKVGDTIEFTLLARQNRVMGKFTCSIKLENEWLVYTIHSIEDSIPSLTFPTPIQNDELIIPNNIGKIYRKKETSGIFTRKLQTFFSHLCMRWIGGQKDGAAWIGIYDEGFEDAGAIIANLHATPFFTRTLGKWSHSYTYRMKFIKGNYVDLAKEYRKWFISKGWFKSLDEKIKKNISLKDFIGGRGFWVNLAHPVSRKKEMEDILFSDDQVKRKGEEGQAMVHMTFNQAKERLAYYRKLGMKKGLIKIAGWINRGYDASHPDVWPPEPKLGNPDELKELMNAGGDGLVMGLHDNYMDVYDCNKSFPKGVIRNEDGSLMQGGNWAGGQAYIMTYKAGLEYAKRNWEQIKTLMPKAIFVDTTTAMQLYQSYEKGNHSTKADDLKNKLETIRFYNEQGVLFGSEEGADFAIPFIDWFENRHHRNEGESIPLWPLVFHDAAFCMRYGSSGVGGSYPKWLEDLLYGYMVHFGDSGNDVDEKKFKETMVVDEWHEKIATAEMTNHRFLTDDYKVEETTFGNGYSILCNFSDKVYKDTQNTVAPYSYKISKG